MTQTFEMLGILLLVVFIVICAVVNSLTPYRFADDGDPLTARIALVEIEGELTYGDEDHLESKVRVVCEIDDRAQFVRALKGLKNSHALFGDPAYLVACGRAIMLTYPSGNIELIYVNGTTYIRDGDMVVYSHMFDTEDFDRLWEAWASAAPSAP